MKFFGTVNEILNIFPTYIKYRLKFSFQHVINKKMINSLLIAAKEVRNAGRSPLLQDPLFGARPTPFSK
jgi:hypothetical protein